MHSQAYRHGRIRNNVTVRVEFSSRAFGDEIGCGTTTPAPWPFIVEKRQNQRAMSNRDKAMFSRDC